MLKNFMASHISVYRFVYTLSSLNQIFPVVIPPKAKAKYNAIHLGKTNRKITHASTLQLHDGAADAAPALLLVVVFNGAIMD